MKNPMKIQQTEKFSHVTILGHVFDVSTYPEMYGINGGYNSLTGIDATLVLAGYDKKVFQGSLDGTKNIDTYINLDRLTTFQLEELINWLIFFDSKYNCIGYIPGLFYEPLGDPTNYLEHVRVIWKKSRKESLKILEKFPKCTSFYDEKTLMLSCGDLRENNSIHKGVPRYIVLPTLNVPMCVCVPWKGINTLRLNILKEIKNCQLSSSLCKVTESASNADFTNLKRTIDVYHHEFI